MLFVEIGLGLLSWNLRPDSENAMCCNVWDVHVVNLQCDFITMSLASRHAMSSSVVILTGCS